MPFLTVPQASGPAVDLHYEDYGQGKPVVLIHGWPLSGRSWEGQVPALVEAGHRVITYDRRGFGQSSQPWNGYDYDTFAADLKAVLDELDLQDVTLIGFSMGGGELARFVSLYGTERIAKLVFASAVPPYLYKASDNPEGGVDDDLAAWFHDGIVGDRPKFLNEFVKMFFTAGKPSLINKPLVSDEQVAYNLAIAELASPKGTLDCTVAFATTDFRDDLTKIDVPTLVIHGDSDAIVPFEVSGKRTHEAVANSELVVIEGAPHGVTVSHKDEWNEHVLAFLAK
ncbi:MULTISPECIES: alpha/beta fold hydrolase [unclassified Frondihabitans]|uniref:alpha/beta fold hydrolase n=1 Tax=unclassified Frondihabitans TaxID=2626248 RepID=UPI000F4DD093|nr:MULTISPECIES: alpha/beta hydrolase [unclassified Frondihabitans]RPE74347.1 pimeloyl-ACP methyl ester carboxylesterase [Frondihabitans sp. PhB153]RPF02776.1 pimeloyl-ACP methyl ester carboxylesterase [Frondihabitans sp. PhB161]